MDRPAGYVVIAAGLIVRGTQVSDAVQKDWLQPLDPLLLMVPDAEERMLSIETCSVVPQPHPETLKSLLVAVVQACTDLLTSACGVRVTPLSDEAPD